MRFIGTTRGKKIKAEIHGFDPDHVLPRASKSVRNADDFKSRWLMWGESTCATSFLLGTSIPWRWFAQKRFRNANINFTLTGSDQTLPKPSKSHEMDAVILHPVPWQMFSSAVDCAHLASWSAFLYKLSVLIYCTIRRDATLCAVLRL